MATRINFVSVLVKDQERARDFYRDVMGMKVHTDADLGEGSVMLSGNNLHCKSQEYIANKN